MREQPKWRKLHGKVAKKCGVFAGSHYRYIDVYARQDGAWKVVSVQITRIPGK